MRPIFSAFLAWGLASAISAAAFGDAAKPPEGYVAIFNGEDLSGWHGMPHFDPRKLAEMSEADRSAKIAEWTADAKKHWSVQDGDLVNDGFGAYLTTDKDYGDIELLIDY